MRKLLNTLHVMTQGSYLHRDGETVAIKVGQELKLRVPVHTLEGLVCWGQVACSPPLLGLCCERGVGVSFMTEQGKFLARVTGPVSGNVLLQASTIPDGRWCGRRTPGCADYRRGKDCEQPRDLAASGPRDRR